MMSLMRLRARLRYQKLMRRLTVILSFCGLLSCISESEPPKQPQPDLSPVEYSFAGLDGSVVVASTLRGRTTVLLFVTTFDLISQAQAKRLEDLYRTHAPRINAVAVIMETPKHVDLARSFRDVLKLSYTVALSSKVELSEHPVFRRIETVPAWIVLDALGRPHASATGALSVTALEDAVTSAQAE